MQKEETVFGVGPETFWADIESPSWPYDGHYSYSWFVLILGKMEQTPSMGFRGQRPRDGGLIIQQVSDLARHLARQPALGPGPALGLGAGLGPLPGPSRAQGLDLGSDPD